MNFEIDQDQGLDQLSEALTRTQQIGMNISDTLDEHKRLLNSMESAESKVQNVFFSYNPLTD